MVSLPISLLNWNDKKVYTILREVSISDALVSIQRGRKRFVEPPFCIRATIGACATQLEQNPLAIKKGLEANEKKNFISITMTPTLQ